MKKLSLYVSAIIIIAGVWAIATYAVDNIQQSTVAQQPAENVVPEQSETESAQPEESEPIQSEPTKQTISGKRAPGKECPAFLTDRPEEIVCHEGFTLSYNNKRLIPNWVAWVMTAQRAAGTEKRANNFQPDLTVKNGPVAYDTDYRGSGYDRGHMCPSADCKQSRQSQNQCFLLSNICPQIHELNCGDWNELENKTRKWTKRCDSLYIVCGPIIRKGEKYKTIGEHNVMVPNQFYKVFLRFNRSKIDAIGFIFKNETTEHPLDYYACSVDDVETLTGINFFSKLPKDVERKVEVAYNFDDWR